MANEEVKISLKLLVDTSTNKVLFAEAGKDFVDFILHMMSLPLGTVVKLLNQKKMVGCLGDLYKSVESLNNQYFQSDHNKDSVLNPKLAVNVPLLSLTGAPTSDTADTYPKLYKCNSSHNYFTDSQGEICPDCRRFGDGRMHSEMIYVKPAGSNSVATSSGGEGGGFVKGVVSYMIMDNLEVKPMSTISGLTMMNKFCIKDVASLAEVESQFGLEEGLAILKASLETKSVLTSVFCPPCKYDLV